jgi:hypothetical protein
MVRNLADAAGRPTLEPAPSAMIHEDWIEATRYLDIDLLREQDRSLPRPGEAARVLQAATGYALRSTSQPSTT